MKRAIQNDSNKNNGLKNLCEGVAFSQRLLTGVARSVYVITIEEDTNMISGIEKTHEVVMTDEKRAEFFTHVEIDDNGCWLWTGKRLVQRGVPTYGYYSFRGQVWYVHQLAYALVSGGVPAGGVVRHSCDVKNCCRFDHLDIGTHEQNMRDVALRNTRSDYKLTDDNVRDIRTKSESIKAQAAKYGVSEVLISKIRNGTRRQYVV